MKQASISTISAVIAAILTGCGGGGSNDTPSVVAVPESVTAALEAHAQAPANAAKDKQKVNNLFQSPGEVVIHVRATECDTTDWYQMEYKDFCNIVAERDAAVKGIVKAYPDTKVYALTDDVHLDAFGSFLISELEKDHPAFAADLYKAVGDYIRNNPPLTWSGRKSADMKVLAQQLATPLADGTLPAYMSDAFWAEKSAAATERRTNIKNQMDKIPVSYDGMTTIAPPSKQQIDEYLAGKRYGDAGEEQRLARINGVPLLKITKGGARLLFFKDYAALEGFRQ